MAVSDLQARKDNKAPWQTCATCHLLETLDEERANQLLDLLSDDGVRYSEIAGEIADDPKWSDVSIDWQPLSRHARGKCAARQKLRGA